MQSFLENSVSGSDLAAAEEGLLEVPRDYHSGFVELLDKSPDTHEN